MYCSPSSSTASFVGSPVFGQSKAIVRSLGSAVDGRFTASTAEGVVAAAEGEAAADVAVPSDCWILSEFVEELLLQAVRRRAAVRAVVATAVAVGRVVRDT
jgi:hypothetical protein